MDIIEHNHVYFVIKQQFLCKFSAPMESHMALKNTEICVYGDEMFLSTILLKHPSLINRVLHINLDTSDVPIHRTKVWWTIQDIS